MGSLQTYLKIYLLKISLFVFLLILIFQMMYSNSEFLKANVVRIYLEEPTQILRKFLFDNKLNPLMKI